MTIYDASLMSHRYAAQLHLGHISAFGARLQSHCEVKQREREKCQLLCKVLRRVWEWSHSLLPRLFGKFSVSFGKQTSPRSPHAGFFSLIGFDFVAIPLVCFMAHKGITGLFFFSSLFI